MRRNKRIDLAVMLNAALDNLESGRPIRDYSKKSFRAKTRGRCAECGIAYRDGEVIIHANRGTYEVRVHLECPDVRKEFDAILDGRLLPVNDVPTSRSGPCVICGTRINDRPMYVGRDVSMRLGNGEHGGYVCHECKVSEVKL